MLNISFSLTTEQFKRGEKDVTRRLGWLHLKAGDHLMACVKCMGLKRGEHPVQLGEIEVVSVRREHLYDITKADVIREGFPDLSVEKFVWMFRQHMKCYADTIVTRIEFRKVKP